MFKRLLVVCLMFMAMLTFAGLPAQAQDSEQATTDEVFELILKAVSVLEGLGEEGFQAFNDPNGEFTLKDTYVAVQNCDTMTILAHPNTKYVGAYVGKLLDRNPDPAKSINPSEAICELQQDPNGGWIEYYSEKLGDDTPSRKISFILGIPDTPWVVIAGIYNDTVSVEELNAKIP